MSVSTEPRWLKSSHGRQIYLQLYSFTQVLLLLGETHQLKFSAERTIEYSRVLTVDKYIWSPRYSYSWEYYSSFMSTCTSVCKISWWNPDTLTSGCAKLLSVLSARNSVGPTGNRTEIKLNTEFSECEKLKHENFISKNLHWVDERVELQRHAHTVDTTKVRNTQALMTCALLLLYAPPEAVHHVTKVRTASGFTKGYRLHKLIEF